MTKKLIGIVMFFALASFVSGAAFAKDRDNNPPGKRGGPGTNWENPAGPAGGPGASPNARPVYNHQHNYQYKHYNAYHHCASAYCNQHPHKCACGEPVLDNDSNPPGAAGGPGTNWENPPGPAGGTGASPNKK